MAVVAARTATDSAARGHAAKIVVGVRRSPGALRLRRARGEELEVAMSGALWAAVDHPAAHRPRDSGFSSRGRRALPPPPPQRHRRRRCRPRLCHSKRSPAVSRRAMPAGGAAQALKPLNLLVFGLGETRGAALLGRFSLSLSSLLL